MTHFITREIFECTRIEIKEAEVFEEGKEEATPTFKPSLFYIGIPVIVVLGISFVYILKKRKRLKKNHK